MRDLAITITIGAILAVTTAGYYGSDMLLGDEDNSLVSTDENNLGAEQASEQDNILSEDREIKGRDNKDAETEQEASADTASKDGIIMSSNLVAGENARLVIYEEGNRVTGETVYLNGEEIGETSQTGALTFEVPNKEEIKISTDSGLEKIITSVEGYDERSGLEVNFISPRTDQVQGFEADIVMEFEASEDLDYSIVIDNEVIEDGSLDSGARDSFSEIISFRKGQHQMYVNWSTGSETRQTMPIEFETTEERPIAELSLTTPDDGYVLTDIDGSKTLGYNIVDYESGELSLLLNDTVLQTHQLDGDGDVNYFDYELAYSENISGYNEWYAEFSSDSTVESERRVIEVE